MGRTVNIEIRKLSLKIAEMKPKIHRPLNLRQKVIFSGFSLSYLTYKCMNQVKCEANISGNRLTGFKYSDKEIKFDWKRFWLYLKPHMLKLLIAIIVSNL